MRIADIITRSILVALGAVATFAFVVTKIPAALAWATSRSYEFGDLYRFAKIGDFKPAIPLPTGSSAHLDSIDVGHAHPNPEDIIFLGDSFSFCDWGQGSFVLQVQRELGLPLFSVYNNHHTAPWENPYPFLHSASLRSKSGRIVVYEIVERSLQRQFETSPADGKPQQPSEPNWPAFSRIKSEVLEDTETRNEALLDNSNLTFPIISVWNTLLFDTLGRITPETPLFSLKPPFLFYKGEVQCFDAVHSDELIAGLADHIALLSKDLKSKLNETLVFMPVPNKITLYSYLVKEKPYDGFLPRLCAALKERGVNTVDLLPALRQQSQFQLLYWPADTHWNDAAIQIAVGKLAESWPRQP